MAKVAMPLNNLAVSLLILFSRGRRGREEEERRGREEEERRGRQEEERIKIKRKRQGRKERKRGGRVGTMEQEREQDQNA